MSNGSLKVVPSVFTIVGRNKKVLLLRRANTGWLDGWYDLPAGHLEDQEKLKAGAARELKEETGIIVAVKDLRLAHVYQNHHRPENPHYGFIFQASKWRGKPKIVEPDKCADMGFFALDKLPPKLTPYVREALENLDSPEVTISYQAPGSIK
jgi:8-oxo-dGTP diphosphatase